MVGQSERKMQAVHKSIPEADIMRTIIATAVAVVTAAVLINSCKPAQVAVHFDQVAITEHVSAQAATATTPAPEPTPQADKPVPVEVKQAVVQPQAAQPVPTSSCEAELGKYSWSQSAAHNVMMQESSNDHTILNDNPMTGDYSVGCFQINLIGANINDRYRIAVTLGYTGEFSREGMVPWLKDPVNNVAVAHALYARAGNWGDWKNTCTKVQCY